MPCLETTVALFFLIAGKRRKVHLCVWLAPVGAAPGGAGGGGAGGTGQSPSSSDKDTKSSRTSGWRSICRAGQPSSGPGTGQHRPRGSGMEGPGREEPCGQMCPHISGHGEAWWMLLATESRQLGAHMAVEHSRTHTRLQGADTAPRWTQGCAISTWRCCSQCHPSSTSAPPLPSPGTSQGTALGNTSCPVTLSSIPLAVPRAQMWLSTSFDHQQCPSSATPAARQLHPSSDGW